MANQHCYCWAILPKDGPEINYTTTNRDFEFLGKTWTPYFSVNNTVVQKNIGLGVDNVDLSGPFSEEISKERVESGYFSEAKVAGYRVNLVDTSDYSQVFSGILGEFTIDEVKYSVEARSKTLLLNKPRTDVYTRTCPFSFGDSSCGVDTTALSTSVTIASTSGLNMVVSGGSLEDLYSLGKVTYSDGSFQFIRSQNGNQLSLWENPYGSVGDTITLTQGCNKTRQACKGFSNIENFGGFDLIPPEEILTTFANSTTSAVFDGGSYFERLD